MISGLTKEDFDARWQTMDDEKRLLFRAVVDAEYNKLIDPTPGSLARRLDPLTVQTPALDLIDAALVQVRDAINVMYARRGLLAKLMNERTIDQKEAIERVSEEIPDKGIRRLIISMPPQEGKSSRVSRYNLEWLLRQFPKLRIGLISYDGVNAGQFSYQIRSDIEMFNGYSDEYDLGLRLRSDEKAKSRWQLNTGGGVFAIGIGGGMTGRPLDLANLDDVVKDYRAADSTLLSEQSWEWWQTVCRPRLAPWAPVILTMTRWHEFDLAGRMITKQREDEAMGTPNYDKWVTINIPAQADSDDDPLDREPGEFMVSARGRTIADWETTKNGTDPRFWSALYQGKPTPDAGDVFQREWWRRYDEVLWQQSPDGSFSIPLYQITQSWDLSFRDSSTSDFVVGQLWAKKGADSFLVYQVRARMDFPKTVDAIKRMRRLFPDTRKTIIEGKANGDAVIASLRNEIPGIIEGKPDASKVARARAVTTYVRAGNIHIPTTAVATASPEIAFSPDDFIMEHTSFPNGAHDDQVDAFTQYSKEMYLGNHTSDRFLSELADVCGSCGQPNVKGVELCNFCHTPMTN